MNLRAWSMVGPRGTGAEVDRCGRASSCMNVVLWQLSCAAEPAYGLPRAHYCM